MEILASAGVQGGPGTTDSGHRVRLIAEALILLEASEEEAPVAIERFGRALLQILDEPW